MKKIVLFVFLALPIFLLAEGNSFVAKGGIGSITLNDQVYNRVSLYPELSVWKFALGLDIELLFDKDGKIYKKDWEDAEDYVNKILYFRFAQRGDPFYFLMGNISSYTLGKGLIMQDYCNDLLYPDERKLGAMVGFNVANWSAEFFSADVIENDILAARVAYSPISRLQIGVSGAADLDQYNGISDQDGDNFPDIYDDFPNDENYYDKYQKDKTALREAWIKKFGDDSGFEDYFNDLLAESDHKKLDELKKSEDGKKEVYEVGADYTVDIYRGRSLFLQHYGEVAHIVDHGYGFVFPGFIAKFFIFDLNAGFRHYGKEFTAPYFGHLYDQNRVEVTKVGDSAVIVTKEEQLDNLKAANGWQATLTSDFFGVMDLKVSYNNMHYDDDKLAHQNIQGIEGVLSLRPNVVPKISTAYIKYSQENEPKLFEHWKTETTYIEGKVGLELTASTSVNWLYTERYKDLNGDGKISGRDETISNVSFGVEMTF